MAQPKSKISKARTSSRRTANMKLEVTQGAVCKTSGAPHLPHRAARAEDGAIYFKGKLIKPAKVQQETT